jgi:hypothetical protein
MHALGWLTAWYYRTTDPVLGSARQMEFRLDGVDMLRLDQLQSLLRLMVPCTKSTFFNYRRSGQGGSSAGGVAVRCSDIGWRLSGAYVVYCWLMVFGFGGLICLAVTVDPHACCARVCIVMAAELS